MLSPNAASGVLDGETIARLRCRAVVGGANDPLAPTADEDALAARGILWAPDYVVSAGGVLSRPFETGDWSAERTRAEVATIGDRLVAVWTRAAREGRTPGRVAESMVEERLAAAGPGAVP